MVDIKDLTLREKILQTMVIRGNPDNYVNEQVGGIFFGGEIITQADETGVENAKKVLEKYIDNAKIPILITSDFENGCGSMLKGLTPLPYLMSLGATQSEQLAYDYGKATALEAKSIGANWTFSPVSDLNINPRNPLVNVRSISDNPTLAIKLLKQIVRGMQENGLAACAKHFPGDGVDYRDQHIITTHNTLSLEEWKKLSGRVFKELIDDGVYSIMAGHITLPAYQKETDTDGLKLPATLSYELITKLLKQEMGFDGVVVTDALNMGGFLGWYPTKREATIESFKAGCDMVLWPEWDYVDDMIKAVESGYISMERLDDAVTRILNMKKKLGMFSGDNHAKPLRDADKEFVAKVQQETAEKSITLIRDNAKLFPLSTEKYKKIAVVPVTHYAPAFEEAELLCEELRTKGFHVDYYKTGLQSQIMSEYEARVAEYDLIIYALFSRSFRPIGPVDFSSGEAGKIMFSLQCGTEKTVIVSFGSPYHINQYFERAKTCVNAYSMLSPSVKAFVRAAVGEIEFTEFSPVNL